MRPAGDVSADDGPRRQNPGVHGEGTRPGFPRALRVADAVAPHAAERGRRGRGRARGDLFRRTPRVGPRLPAAFLDRLLCTGPGGGPRYPVPTGPPPDVPA